MAQTFSQLIRIRKNIAVQYEIRIVPEVNSENGSKNLQWFKHNHWQETLQLLRPIVQGHVIKGEFLERQSKPHETISSTIKGHGVVVAFVFKTSSLSQVLVPSGSSTSNTLDKRKSDKEFRDLGKMHNFHQVYPEKLIAAVSANNGSKIIEMDKYRTLMSELRIHKTEQQNDNRPSNKDSNSSHVGYKESGVYVMTESIKCHQGDKAVDKSTNKSAQQNTKTLVDNKVPVKALSCRQLENSHKCRSSTVKLSPSSAMTQENFMVARVDVNCDHRATKRKNTKRGYDTELKVKNKKIKHDLVSTSDRSQNEKSSPKLPSFESQKYIRKFDAGLNSTCKGGEKPRKTSSLVTSTESIMCTVISQDGRKNVTSPMHIRRVNKQLPHKTKNNYYRSYSDTESYNCPNSSRSCPSTRSVDDDVFSQTNDTIFGNELNNSPQKSFLQRTSEVSMLDDDVAVDEEDHQKEVSKLFDKIFAHSAVDSSQNNIGIEKRRQSFRKLIDEHDFQQSADHERNREAHSEETDREPSSDQIERSKMYETMKEAFASVKKINGLSEETLNQWFIFNEYYLRGIFEGKIFCRRHEDYKKGGKLRVKLNYQINLRWFSEDQLDFIMEYLMHIFGESNSQTTNYLLKVMLPEVLTKIFMDFHNIGHDESEMRIQSYV